MKASAVNLATFANALCHLNATPLSVAVLAPCAWGENLACGVAWQGVLLGRNGAWRVFADKTKRGDTTNSARIKWSSACGQSKQKENGAVFGRGTSLSLSLSRCSHLWHAFALNLKGFFTHFVVDFAHFIAISSQLIANFSYFIVVLIHLFACKRHFLGHCAFLKFLNALFLGFLRSSLRAVFAKTA